MVRLLSAEIEQAHPDGGDILVVSHGVMLLAYLAMVLDIPLRPLLNASVSTVRVDLTDNVIQGLSGTIRCKLRWACRPLS